MGERNRAETTVTNYDLQAAINSEPVSEVEDILEDIEKNLHRNITEIQAVFDDEWKAMRHEHEERMDRTASPMRKTQLKTEFRGDTADLNREVRDAMREAEEIALQNVQAAIVWLVGKNRLEASDMLRDLFEQHKRNRSLSYGKSSRGRGDVKLAPALIPYKLPGGGEPLDAA